MATRKTTADKWHPVDFGTKSWCLSCEWHWFQGYQKKVPLYSSGLLPLFSSHVGKLESMNCQSNSPSLDPQNQELHALITGTAPHQQKLGQSEA